MHAAMGGSLSSVSNTALYNTNPSVQQALLEDLVLDDLGLPPTESTIPSDFQGKVCGVNCPPSSSALLHMHVVSVLHIS